MRSHFCYVLFFVLTTAILKGQDQQARWNLDIGVFNDHYRGDRNSLILADTFNSDFGIGPLFQNFMGPELGLGYRLLAAKRLNVTAGVRVSRKRKLLTYRVLGHEFETGPYYGIDAYYMAVPISIMLEGRKRLQPALAFEPGISLWRRERNDVMSKAGVPSRFDDVWKYNAAITPGVRYRILDNLFIEVDARFYLRSMRNDWSKSSFSTTGLYAGVSYAF